MIHLLAMYHRPVHKTLETLMAKRLPNDGAGWSTADLKKLKQLAKSGVTAAVAAKDLGRTASAVQQKAMRTGISFRAGQRAAKKSSKK